MMQHYRTHMSPKSRRSQKRGVAEEARPRPRLHAHHRIRSDPVRVEPPLTIDQHLSNYHQSLRTTDRHTPVRFNFPLPLSSTARSPLIKPHESTPSPTLSHSSSTSLPSIQHIIDDKPSTPKETLFYQHRPLTFTRPQNSSFPYTLLHPAQQQEEELSNVAPNQSSGNYPSSPKDDPKDEDPMDEDGDRKSPSSGGLLQLAHIVSTFG
jgi:hypothetical protein